MLWVVLYGPFPLIPLSLPVAVIADPTSEEGASQIRSKRPSDGTEPGAVGRTSWRVVTAQSCSGVVRTFHSVLSAPWK